MPMVERGTWKRHSSEIYKTFSICSNNPRGQHITVFKDIWNIFPLTSSRFTFREFWLILAKIFALVPIMEQGTRKRHSSEIFKTFSKWSNTPRGQHITVSRHIWNIFPLTSSRFTFRRFWPKKCQFWEKILLGPGGANFSERHSFRWKLFRSYLRPFVVELQLILRPYLVFTHWPSAHTVASWPKSGPFWE